MCESLMASGSSASRMGITYPIGDRPYSARELTMPEVRAGDIHSFDSPKEGGRRVRVDGVANIAQALLLELDPGITAFTERPRQLTVENNRYELSFWCRLRSGEERMLLVVPGAAHGGQRATRRQHREAGALIDAARAAHVPLEFVYEADLLAQPERIALAYRLLPDVQTARLLTNRGVLEQEILTLIGRHERLRFSQLSGALGNFLPADVQCVVAYLLHAGALVSDASDRLTRSTLLGLST